MPHQLNRVNNGTEGRESKSCNTAYIISDPNIIRLDYILVYVCEHTLKQRLIQAQDAREQKAKTHSHDEKKNNKIRKK